MTEKVRQYPFRAFLSRYRSRYTVGMIALFLVDLINVVLPILIKEAVDAIPRRSFTRVAWVGAAYLAVMALQSWGRYLWRIYLMGTSHRIARDLRHRLYGHLQRLPLAHYQTVRTGDLMSRATNDIESVRMAVGPGILVTADAVLMFLMIVPVMLYFSVKLSLLAFAFYPAVPWITARLGDRIDTLFESLQTRMSRLGAHAQESFSAIRLVKSLVLETRTAERFAFLSAEYRREGMQLARYEAAFSPVLGLLTNLGTFLILLLGGLDVIHGVITVGTFIAFQRFVVQLSWPMEAIGWAVTMNREGTAAYRRLQEVFDTEPVCDARVEAAPAAPTSALLEIRGLHAAAPGGAFALQIEDLALQPGQRVGLVGPVGSGKSTLFSLLLRLYEPPPGMLFLRGRDIASIPQAELRARIASVEQQVFLFSEDIQANILMGARGNHSPAEVRRSVEVAGILDEILELERGFETALGERGVNLSGGQKQRIALARALVREPEMLLLDDCFSAVDVAVEQRIIEGLFREFPSLSFCFASHRLSVMPHMDEIWLLDRGRLVDRAPHAELLKTSSLYRALWEKSERQVEEERLGTTPAAEASLL